MSYDLYLFDLADSDDAEAAARRLDELNKSVFAGAGEGKHKERLAQALMEADRRYQKFEKDYQAIADFEGISLDEAMKRYDWLELNGPPDAKLAQITIHADFVVIEWYSGTSEAEMTRYLRLICRETGYAVFDPQSCKIMRFPNDEIASGSFPGNSE